MFPKIAQTEPSFNEHQLTDELQHPKYVLYTSTNDNRHKYKLQKRNLSNVTKSFRSTSRLNISISNSHINHPLATKSQMVSPSDTTNMHEHTGSSFFQMQKTQAAQFFSAQMAQKSTMNAQYEIQKDQEEDKALFKRILSSRQQILLDQNVPNIMSQSSVQEFYKHLKKLDTVLQQNKFHSNVSSTPYTNILNKCQKLNIMPSRVGLITPKIANDESLEIRNMRFGDKYMTVLGKGFKNVQTIKNFDLSNNRITEQSVIKLLSNIVDKAQKIDISYNRIGKIGSGLIQKSLLDKECKLQALNLEANYLGSQVVQPLLEALSQNGGIRNLNLSKNYLDDKIADSLKQCIEGSSLSELYLHWNSLKASTGRILFETLKENEYLRVLDLSNNCLGIESRHEGVLTKSCAVEIGDFFEKNKELFHLDLSFNQINYEQTQLMAQKLEKNKSIFGFHFAGNHGYVDVRGFLVPVEVQQDLQGMQVKKRIDELRVVKKRQLRQGRDKALQNVCWLCEGWNEISITWGEYSSKSTHKDMFIHFNFEDYGSVYLGQDFKEVRRMVPPGILNYFFSDHNDIYFVARDHQTQLNTTSNQIIEQVETYEGFKDIKISELNIQTVPKNFELIQYSQWQVQTLPREKPLIFVPPKKKKTKIKWTFNQSVFSKWIPDDAELLTLCFEYDWECSKVPKIVKEESQLVKIKEFLREHYKHIKDTYKHYACTQPIGDVWAIQQLAFQDIIDKCKIIDSKVTFADINIKWTAVVSGIKGLTTMPAYQFFQDQEKLAMIKGVINTSDFMGLDFLGDDIKFEKEKYQQQLEIRQIYVQLSEEKLEKYEKLRMPDVSYKLRQDRSKVWQTVSQHMKNIGTTQVDAMSLQGGKNLRNPERGINRYQMLEVIVRLAEEKYIKHNVTKDMFEAVQLLWKMNLQQTFTMYNQQYWRESRYWTEECDKVLKYYKRILDYVYKNNAKKKVKPGQTPFMCLDELNKIVSECQLYEEDYFGPQVYLGAFNQSMITQVDELTQDRIFQMNQIEFYEALARISEDALMLPGPGIFDADQEWILDKKRQLPLHYKLEGLVIRMFHNCTDAEFKKNHPPLIKSVFWVDPDESDFELIDG